MSYEPEKSYVSMEQKVCVVCTTKFDSGSILLDTRLRKSMEHHTVTGWGFCPEHQRMRDDGYIALVAIDINRSSPRPNGNIDPEDAYRLGPIAHIRRSAAERVLIDVKTPLPDVMFVEEAVIDRLAAMQQEAEAAPPSDPPL